MKNAWVEKHKMKPIWVSEDTHSALCVLYRKGDTFDKIVKMLILHWNKVDSHESKKVGVGEFSYKESWEGDL